MQSSTTTTGADSRTLGQIHSLLSPGNTLEAKTIDLNDFSRIISKMPNRNSKDVVNSVVSKLFEVAAAKITDEHDKAIVLGLQKYVAAVQEDLLQPKPRYLDAFFFPNERNIEKLVTYLTKATKSLKICVFNLTNDRLAQAIADAKKRGVDVRLISDDECMSNQGSDVSWLATQGVPVRTDDNPSFHMHNKFAIIDDTHLITGSFNWTVQAGKSNQENILVVDHPYYIEKYNAEFEGLWRQFEKNAVNSKLSQEEKEVQAATTIQT